MRKHLCLWLAAMLVATACQAVAGSHAGGPKVEPVKAFMKSPSFTQVRISPNGKYLSAVVPMPNEPYANLLAILDGKTGKVLQVIKSGQKSLISSYFWANNDRLVASMAIKRNGLDTPSPTGELFAINVDGSDQMNLFGFRATNGNLLKSAQKRYAAAFPLSSRLIDGRYILVEVYKYSNNRKGVYPTVEKLDIYSGRTLHVSSAPARRARFAIDHAGRVRAAYAQNVFGRSRLWTRADNGDDWILTNDPAKSGRTITPIGFNRDNSLLYVRVSEGTGPDAIELMDPASGKLTMVFKGKFADPGHLLSTADGMDFYAVVDRDGIPSLHYIEPNSPEAKLSKALTKSFPGQFVFLTSFTPDGKRAIVHVGSDRNPGDYYLFNANTHKARYMFSAAPWIDPQKMRPMKPVQLQARDGLTLHGFLTLPAGNKPYPFIVLPHGGPHGISDQWGFNREAQLFAEHGYAVLQVNYRGSGGYGSHFQQLGYRQWGLKMQDDLTDATHWAIDQGYAKAGNICIYGGSYGGYAALEGAVREPDLYKCAIGYAGVYDLRVQLHKSDTSESDFGVSYMNTVLGTDPKQLLAQSPLSGVSRIKANLLLIHGKSDPRVPYKNFREFTKALTEDGKSYETLVEPNEGHGFFTMAHRIEAYTKMLQFLGQNLEGQTGSTDAD